MKLGFLMREYRSLETDVDWIRVLTGSLERMLLTTSLGRSLNDRVSERTSTSGSSFQSDEVVFSSIC